MPRFESLALIGRTAQIALLVAVLAMLMGLLWNHFQLVSYPALLDYNEGAMPTITQTFISGSSPYTFESQPARINLYPPLYNILTAPFSLVFGNTLQLHRMVVGVFLLASVIICFCATHRASNSLVSSIAAAAIFYAGLLFYSTPIASPNSVGLFFFLVSVLTPWFDNFSNRSLAIALLAGVLAFYSKQYFVASLGYVSLYMFLAVSKKRAMFFWLISALAFIVSIYFVQLIWPYYLDNTIFSVRGATSLIANNKTSLIQLQQFARTNLGLIIFVFLALARFVFLRFRGKTDSPESLTSAKPGFMIYGFDKPLFSHPLNYFWFCFTCSLVVIVLIIGRNPGNHMTYLFQLLAPFFLIPVFTLSASALSLKVLIFPLALWSAYNNYAMLPSDFSVDVKGQERLEAAFEGKRTVYGSPVILPLLTRKDITIYNNGHTGYFGFAQSKPALFRQELPAHSPLAIWNKHIDRIYSNIGEKKFDLIVLDNWTAIPDYLPPRSSPGRGAELLKNHYRRTQNFSIRLANRPGGGAYPLQIWEPRK